MLESKKFLVAFGSEGSSGGAADKDVLGGKGANLCEMAKLGMPVPPGLVISVAAYHDFQLAPSASQYSLSLATKVIDHFQRNIVPKFGYMPLLSVRSGARVSMPGMMDTLLNVGITSENFPEWKERMGEQAATDCYCRLISMYGQTVNGIDPKFFKDLRPIPELYMAVYSKATSKVFPDTLLEQVSGAIRAVFRSWNSERATAYRKLHGYSDDWGTAVVVQSMVFGNLGPSSGSGVLFTRNPSTGEKGLVGEYLDNAQGEEVVAGTRTPHDLFFLAEENPSLYLRLEKMALQLENHFGDMQDIEFTIQNGGLFLLQTRTAKRSALAAFKVAYDLVAEGRIERESALKRVSSQQFAFLKRETVDPSFKGSPLTTGLPASYGVVSGRAVFSGAEANECDEPYILIREETSPDDFPVMSKAAGILTSTGGSTSHAAVVARGMNKPAVVGASDLRIQSELFSNSWVKIGNQVVIQQGDYVTIDGSTGRVWTGKVPVLGGSVPSFVQEMLRWNTNLGAVIVGISASNTATELPETGYYYISLTELTRAKYMKILLKALGTKHSLHGVIGFERLGVMVLSDDQDRKFVSFFGLGGEKLQNVNMVPEDTIEAFITAASVRVLPKKLKKRFSLHMPMSATEDQVARLTRLGWSVVREVRSLKDLLSATGFVKFSAEFHKRLSEEGVQFDEVLALFRKAGREVRELPRIVGEDELVVEALGK